MSDFKDFVIENGVLERYFGKSEDVIIPQGVTFIGSRAFNFSELASITIPESVIAFQGNPFFGRKKPKKVYVENLSSWCAISFDYYGTPFDDSNKLVIDDKIVTELVIPDNVTTISDYAFHNCSCIRSVVIPKDITNIGHDAFAKCKNLEAFTVDEDNQYFSSLDGVLFDKNKSVLIQYPTGKKNVNYTIPDSVLKINNYAFSGCMALKEIVIPEGVEKIGSYIFEGCQIEKIIQNGQTPNLIKQNIGDQIGHYEPTVEFPEVCLATREKLPALVASNAIIKNAREYAHVWRFQSGKIWDELLIRSVVDRNDVVTEFSNLLAEEKKTAASQWKRLLQFLELYAHTLKKNVIEDFIKSVSEKDNKTAKMFKDSSVINEALSRCDANENHSIEEKVEKALEITLTYSAAIKEIKVGIQYADSDTICDPKVLAFIISEYMKLHNPESVRYISEYKTACMPYEFATLADEIAASLNRNQLQEVLMTLAFEKGGLFILPFARYADEKSAAALVTQMKKWENWGQYAATGRKNIIIARCGLLLSDTKAAMLHLDDVGKLDIYAKMRNLNAQTIRDTVLSDFGFDDSGLIHYSLGDVNLAIRLKDDLTLQIFDESNNKELKTIPKKNVELEIFEKVKAEIFDLKKNVKKVTTNRKKIVFEQFLSGEIQDVDTWKKLFIENAVFNKFARLVVWQQEEATFTVSSSDTVDAFGNIYILKDAPVGVAHPVEMDKTELEAWQKYFVKNQLKQPFEQVWEPAYNSREICANRYKNCEISAYKVFGKEMHGIYAVGMFNYSEDYGFDLKDCKLEHTQLQHRFMHGENNRFVLGKFSFNNFSRGVNHIVYLFDKWTIDEKIMKDDISLAQMLTGFTIAQLTEFIKIAGENNATNVMALLLDYKNKKFADFDPMDEFVLE